MRYEDLVYIDKTHIWHPFTQMQEWIENQPIIIEKGKGSYLIDIQGNKYLDGVSSLWTNVHGHNNPTINKAISAQLKKIAHSTFLGLSNVAAIEFTERLIEIVPNNLSRVFFSDNGSTSVEVALKIAYQYWQQHPVSQNKTKKKFISFHNAYHGDTLGSVSVGGIDLFHGVYSSLLFDTIKVAYPYALKEKLSQGESEQKSLNELEKILQAQSHNIAALIIEPLMQGASGMLNTTATYLQKVRQLTKTYNVLMIVDEVATGFGRTGAMFACDKANIQPDIMCMAKGISGGYLPLAATLTTEDIFNNFLGNYSENKTFFHGHTYTANQLACSAGLASLKLFEKNNILERLQEKIIILIAGLQEIGKLLPVAQIRQEGFMIGIEIYQDKENHIPFPSSQKIGYRICQEAIRCGVFLRPLGDTLILMPPLSISKKELKLLLEITKHSIIKILEDDK